MPKDEARGVEYIQRAALAGNVQAQFELFEAFNRGSGMQKEAITWLKTSAEGGYGPAQLR